MEIGYGVGRDVQVFQSRIRDARIEAWLTRFGVTAPCSGLAITHNDTSVRVAGSFGRSSRAPGSDPRSSHRQLRTAVG